MITLVTGGSGSGKSAYAEKILASCIGEKYYIATMQVYDAEGEKKVEKHRKLRAGKGFVTVESPVDVGKIEFCGKTEKKAALLECMSNLVANEMFSQEGVRSGEQVAEKIINEVQVLSKKTSDLVIVTNNVFEDGIIYEEGTMEYLKALGRINTALAQLSDRVTEVVAGIPLELKG